MAGSRFKSESGILVKGANSIFETEVSINANLTVTADLLTVVGDLYVGGDQVIVGNNLYDSDMLPVSPTGRAIGNTTHRFDCFYRNISISGNVTPTVSSLNLGTASNRWNMYATNVSSVGTLSANQVSISGNTSMSGALFVADTLTVNSSASVAGALTVGSTLTVNSNALINGSLTVTGGIISAQAANVSSVGLTDAIIASNTNSRAYTVGLKGIVDSFPVAVGRAGKVQVLASYSTSRHTIEMTFAHDGTNVMVSRYGEVYNSPLGTFDVDIAGANVNVYFTSSLSGTILVKTLRQVIA